MGVQTLGNSNSALNTVPHGQRVSGGPPSLRSAPICAKRYFGGTLVVQTGWEWAGPSGQRFRWGLHYLNGKSNQYQFHTEHEEQIGLGTWFDF